jgi:hypothetical protein
MQVSANKPEACTKYMDAGRKPVFQSSGAGLEKNKLSHLPPFGLGMANFHESPSPTFGTIGEKSKGTRSVQCDRKTWPKPRASSFGFNAWMASDIGEADIPLHSLNASPIEI